MNEGMNIEVFKSESRITQISSQKSFTWTFFNDELLSDKKVPKMTERVLHVQGQTLPVPPPLRFFFPNREQ